MRLTLRTLLAYLDDTLEPAQAKIIGQKVAESEVARELIERIKQVTRRRRLAAPPATGPGSKLDTNSVAEYIDNVLPDGEITEVEETFLNSDVHLAEVASCHQILTLFLGQPTEVPPTARQRMVGLVKGRESVVRRPARRYEPDELGAANLPDEADEALLLGMPSYLRKNTWARRLIPVAAVLGLVVLLLVAIWQIVPRGNSPLVGGSKPGTRDNSVAVAGPEGIPAPTRPAGTQPAKEPEKEPDKKTPEKEPEKQPIHDVSTPEKPSKERREVGKFVASEVPAPSVLVQHAPAGKPKDQWVRLKPDADIVTTDTLVSLPGFRSEVKLNNNVSLTLWGNLSEILPLPVLESSAVLYVPADGFDLDCTLNQGLIVIANKKPVGKARARLRFQEEVWEITLDDGGAIALALYGEYTGRIPFKSDGSGEAPLMVLDAFGLQGDVEVKVNSYQSFALPVAAFFRWDNTGPRNRSPRPLAPDAIRWYTDKTAPDTPQFKAVVTALKDLSKRLTDKAPVLALAETIKDAKGATLALAVFSLAAVDDTAGMVAALGDKEHLDVRWFAGQTVRHWIGIGLENDMRFYKALQKTYSIPQSEAIMRMLHGFSKDDWAKVDTYEWLVEKLESKEVAIRELAFAQLWSHVPEAAKIPYRPGDPEDVRQAGFDKWKKLLDDGKLPPKSPEK